MLFTGVSLLFLLWIYASTTGQVSTVREDGISRGVAVIQVVDGHHENRARLADRTL